MTNVAEERGISPIVIPDLARDLSFKNDVKALITLYSIMRKEKPDIVHTHTAKAGALGRLAAIFAGVPIRIHTFHGHIFDGYFSPLRARFFLWIERILAIFTDKVITVSETVENEIISKLKVASSEKSVVIPLGLELEKYAQCERMKGRFRSQFGITGDTLLVGIVGRLVPIKNHIMFLDAARGIIDKMPDKKVRFVIVGDGELMDDLKRQANRQGLESRVIFAGWIGDLSSICADLDLVALTSLNEGTPVSLIEAMASGKAVIATDVGGVRDLIKDGFNGVLAKSRDIAGFTSGAIALLADEGKRRALGENARASVMAQ